jgi:hypothetical protein
MSPRASLFWSLAFVVGTSFTAAAAKPVPLSPARAAKELSINVPGEMRGSYYANPGNDAKLTKTRVLGRGATPRDVVQGALNDCFVDGTLAAIAHAQPEKIGKVFVTKADGRLALDANGRVSMRLYYPRRGGGMVRETIKVSAALPYDKWEQPLFTQPANRKMWASLIEKGYAIQLANHSRTKGWQRLNNGGEPRDMIAAVTGQKSTYRRIVPSAESMEGTWAFLKKATANKQVVVAGSINGSRFEERRERMVKTGLLDAHAKQWTIKGQRMVGDHDQNVMRVFERSGQRYVTLRNPWASFVPRGSGRNDGVYTIPLEKLILFFDGITHSN